MALPAALLDHIAQVLPPERVTAARALVDGPRRIAIRVNTLKGTRAEVQDVLRAGGVDTRAVEWLPDALIVLSGGVAEIQATHAHASGALHLQSLSSMAASHALSPQPNSRVLDCCAAPGSKATHLAALMRNTGTLVAADASRARLYRLRTVLQLLGAQATVELERAERWGIRAPGGFDSVLVDAPCSAEGRALAGDTAAAEDWSPRKCKTLASRQKAILHSAIDACAPGGTVVYSTCTLNRTENEGVLQRALERYGGRIQLDPLPFEIPCALPACAPAPEPEMQQIAHAVRVAPTNSHADGPWMEGFFIARIRKLA